MASVKAERASTGRDWVRIIIERTGNGVTIAKEFEPKKGKDGYPVYEPPSINDKLSFNDNEKAADYVEECLTGKHEPDDDDKKY